LSAAAERAKVHARPPTEKTPLKEAGWEFVFEPGSRGCGAMEH